MGERRKSREVLLQLLFQAEMNPFTKAPEICERAEKLFIEVWEKRKELDLRIEGASEHWKMSRMSLVDRNILRFACYELLYCKDVPPEVVFDEAIEIAKRYGSEDSASFVNGVLDKVWKSEPL